jgi:DNA-binding NtrC family response regulator
VTERAHRPEVFVLDDDDDCRELLRQMFEMFGVECAGAPSLKEMVAGNGDVLACRLIVLDINLGAHEPPGTVAYEWLRDRHYAGRVVFLTGHARNHPLVQQARTLEAQVLEKPVSPEVLEQLATEAHA